MSRVFVSYSSRDSELVNIVIRRLEIAGHEVREFGRDLGRYSPDSKEAISNWERWYRSAILSSDAFIFFASRRSTRSRYAAAELRHALKARTPVILVLLDRFYSEVSLRFMISQLNAVDFYEGFQAGFQELLARVEAPVFEQSGSPTAWQEFLSNLPESEDLDSVRSTDQPAIPMSDAMPSAPPRMDQPASQGEAIPELPKAKSKSKPKKPASKSKPKPKAGEKVGSKHKKKSKAEKKSKSKPIAKKRGDKKAPLAKKRGDKKTPRLLPRGEAFVAVGGPGGDEIRPSTLSSKSLEKLFDSNLEKLRLEKARKVSGITRAKPPKRRTSRKPPEPQARYANVVLLDMYQTLPLQASEPIKPNTLFCLRLDIGELSQLSAVEEAVPFPSHRLPPDIWLDVMVSSTDFAVGRTVRAVGRFTVAEGRFFLPGDGRPARVEGARGEKKGKYLYVYLRAPMEKKLARARITYYYRNHPVQSQLLVASVGSKSSRFKVTTDYTLSKDLTGLEALPRRRQLSILTNDNTKNSHQFIVRAAKADGNLLANPLTFELNSTSIGSVVGSLREKLRSEMHAPTKRLRRKDQLKNDLKNLAPLGWQLFNEAGMMRYITEIYPLLKRSNLVVQVTRPSSSRFVFPWGFLYDIPLTSETELKFCSLVEDWDGESDLFAGEPQQCPAGKHTPNTLCPFGFWGYRYAIEQLSSTDLPPRPITAPTEFNMVMAETQYDVSTTLLQKHARDLSNLLARNFPKAKLVEGADLRSIKDLLGQDTPLVYFYCHGERPSPQSTANTVLGVGKRQKLYPQDFNAWLMEWWDYGEGRKIWDEVRPLIFINACHSLEINPDSLVTYLDAFIESAHASGVIGTEVRVHQELAMEAARDFFSSFLGGDTTGQALHKMQAGFLRSGNLFGLLYTPYCWSDLTIEHS